MTSDGNSFQFNLTPKYGYCDDVRLDGQSTNKLIWLVPHVVKHKGDSEILIWRCGTRSMTGWSQDLAFWVVERG